MTQLIDLSGLARRLQAKVVPYGGCLIWTGAIRGDGYGEIWHGSPAVAAGGPRYVGAHVAAWEVANGELVPPTQLVRHTCDTPLCCDRSHLLLGTHRDNAGDRESRGRGRNGWEGRDRCRRGHKFRPGIDVQVGSGGRVARLCKRCKAANDAVRKQADPA